MPCSFECLVVCFGLLGVLGAIAEVVGVLFGVLNERGCGCDLFEETIT